jgi:diaminopimelate epimerase
MTVIEAGATIKGTYGHGTENDFVIIFDPENKVEVSADQVRRICDRERGVGADGVIRITKRENRWFMDYRNADGSIAEMCGNGIRVMARYLVDRGHQSSGIFAISTRDGNKFLKVPDQGDISVNLGKVTQVPGEIFAEQNGKRFSGYNIDVGNPHAVVFVDSIDEVGSLQEAPIVEPADEYPEGVNVEFVEFLENGELRMRVFERGSGETRSCGTGTCAVAMAATIKRGKRAPLSWVIHAPGGRLVVDLDPHENATLTGPAILIRDLDLTSFVAASNS